MFIPIHLCQQLLGFLWLDALEAHLKLTEDTFMRFLKVGMTRHLRITIRTLSDCSWSFLLSVYHFNFWFNNDRLNNNSRKWSRQEGQKILWTISTKNPQINEIFQSLPCSFLQLEPKLCVLFLPSVCVARGACSSLHKYKKETLETTHYRIMTQWLVMHKLICSCRCQVPRKPQEE